MKIEKRFYIKAKKLWYALGFMTATKIVPEMIEIIAIALKKQYKAGQKNIQIKNIKRSISHDKTTNI
jgi:hypothetical protein